MALTASIVSRFMRSWMRGTGKMLCAASAATQCSGLASRPMSTADRGTLTAQLVREAAQRLSEAKDTNTMMDIDPFDTPWLPRTLEDAYAIQDAIIELPQNQGQLVGWKIGATNKATQQRLGLTSPFYGPIFKSDVVQMEKSSLADDAPVGEVEAAEPVHTIDTSRHTIRGLETEFGLVLGSTLTDAGDFFTPPEVVSAVEKVIPVFEVVGTRAMRDLAGNVHVLVADQGGHAQLLMAPEEYHHDAAMVEWMAISVRAYKNGEVCGEGDAELVLGHPGVATCWLANALRRRGRELRKGDIISSGTCTGVMPLSAGDVCFGTFDAWTPFGRLGPVHVV